MSSLESSLSRSKKMTEAWQRMCETGQMGAYLDSSDREREALMIGGSGASGYEHVIEYLQAFQEWLESSE